MIKINVRWHDGYMEDFDDVVNWRCGASTLWIKHETGRQEWIPLISVRRFTFTQEGKIDTIYMKDIEELKQRL